MKSELPYRPAEHLLIMEYVPESDPYMQSARNVSQHSTDGKIPTGSIIVKNNTIIGSGSNQVPLRNKYLTSRHVRWCFRKLLGIPTGKQYWLCPGCASFKNHSEPRAINNAHVLGNDTIGADLYLYGHWWCCKSCCDVMIRAGIRRVFLLDTAEQLFKK